MTIAYVLNTYPQPSHSFIRREVAALEAAGHSVRRIAMRRPTMPLVDPLDLTEQGKTNYVLERGAAYLAGAVFRRFLSHPAATFQAMRLALKIGARSPLGRLRHLIYWTEGCAVANCCDAEGIQHMHAHFGTNATVVAMLANAAAGPGYSFTVHGPEEFDAPVALSLDHKVARADFVITISQYGKSQLCRWAKPVDWPRIHVVHCGIDPSAFPDPLPVQPGPPRLVNIGRFSEQKGQLALIAAMAMIVQRHPKAHLTLIGDGDMRSDIEMAIGTAGLQDNITLTGWLNEEEIHSELQKAQALIMPSFAEGLPMVIMEAMAAGRPVIASHIAGIPELVQPGQTGWLVPAGDVSGLVECVDILANRPAEELTQMGRAGRLRALERHNVANEAAKLAAYFKSAKTSR